MSMNLRMQITTTAHVSQRPVKMLCTASLWETFIQILSVLNYVFKYDIQVYSEVQ